MEYRDKPDEKEPGIITTKLPSDFQYSIELSLPKGIYLPCSTICSFNGKKIGKLSNLKKQILESLADPLFKITGQSELNEDDEIYYSII